jgi:hypothetical protein
LTLLSAELLSKNAGDPSFQLLSESTTSNRLMLLFIERYESIFVESSAPPAAREVCFRWDSTR